MTNYKAYKIHGIGEKNGVALLDIAPNADKHYAKKYITEAVSQVIDKAYGENR